MVAGRLCHDVISRAGRLYEQCGFCVWEDGWIKEKLMRRGPAKTCNNGHVNYDAAHGRGFAIFSSANILDRFFGGSEFHYVYYVVGSA